MRERQNGAIGASRTAAIGLAGPYSIRIGLIVASLAALLMTLTGAFETSALGLVERLAYWLVIMETGALIGVGVSLMVRTWGRLSDRPTAECALVSLLIAVPLTLVVVGASLVFRGEPPPAPLGFVRILGLVYGVSLAATAVAYASSPTGFRRPAPAGVPADVLADASGQPVDPAGGSVASAPELGAGLAGRLPVRLRQADIYAVEAEDHYLRVHTSAGSDLILLRMTDALAELDAIDGARTHRSWWVARSAVREVVRLDGRAELILEGGIVAPVSRSSMPLLQERHWFD